MRVEFLTGSSMCGVSWGPKTKGVGVKVGRHFVRLGHGWSPHLGVWSLQAGLTPRRPLPRLPEAVEGLMAHFGRTFALAPLVDLLAESFPDEFGHADRFWSAWLTDKRGWLLLQADADTPVLMVGADRLTLKGPSPRGAVRLGVRRVQRGNAPVWEDPRGYRLALDPSPALLSALAAVRSTADWQTPVRLAAAQYDSTLAPHLLEFERMFLASVGGAD